MDCKESKEVLACMLDLGEGFYKSLINDGKIDQADIINFLPTLMSLPIAIEGANLIPAELKDIEASDLVEIKDMILAKLGNLAGIEEKWLIVAQGSINIAIEAIKIAKAFIPAK